MNALMMISDLKAEIEKGVDLIKLQDEEGESVVLNIFEGYMPPKRPKEKSEFPYIVIRYLNESQDNDSSIAKVRLICGIYSEDDQSGWKDLLMLLGVLKTYLLRKRNIGNVFELMPPITTEIPEEQPKNQWVGYLNLQVVLPNIIQEGGVNDVFNDSKRW